MLGMFEWPDGACQQLPYDYHLPSVPLKSAWRLWLLGIPSQGLLPFMQLHPTDLSLPAQRKALSDWRVPLCEMELLARKHLPTLWERMNSQPSSTLADQLFDGVVPHIPRPDDLALSRFRLQLARNKISTIAKILRRTRRSDVAEGRRVRARISNI